MARCLRAGGLPPRVAEAPVRAIPRAGTAAIIAIACYFTLLWGLQGARILTSPIYGLDDFSRTQVVYSIGRFFALSPDGLVRVAAFMGAFQLAVAGVFALHILDRLRSLAGPPVEHGILEAALLLVIAVTLGSAVPALIEGDSSLLRLNTLHMLLASAAALLHELEQRGAPATAAEATPAAAIEGDSFVLR
jgi:hypothetical protein